MSLRSVKHVDYHASHDGCHDCDEDANADDLPWPLQTADVGTAGSVVLSDCGVDRNSFYDMPTPQDDHHPEIPRNVLYIK